MPSSDRNAPSRDRPKPEGARHAGGRPGMEDAPIEPPRYFDPSEPWDQQAAEALTQLYESGEGYLHRRPEDERTWSHRRPSQREIESNEPDSPGSAMLEARLAEIAERLQGSLAAINPDKAVEQLNLRLDALEARFNEALGGVVQRADLDGLKLIEAHVVELAAHVEQTRSRLDRIDAIDEQMQVLMRRLEEGDNKRLDALEKALQDYIADWRRGDERTATALQSLESVVSRVSDSIEAMEAHKPAPDLSLGLLDSAGLGEPAIGSDPLSQVYADADRLLEPNAHRSTLDAADYVAKPEPAAEASQSSAPDVPPEPPAEEHDPNPPGASLPSPTARALAMRAKWRQAQFLGAEADGNEAHEAGKRQLTTEAARPQSARRTRPSLLLAGGITLFAAIGYLLVDVLMATSTGTLPPSQIEQGARPGDPTLDAASVPQPDPGLRRERETIGPRREGRTLPLVQTARIDAIGSAMAAVFRRHAGQRAPVDTAAIDKEAPPVSGVEIAGSVAALPMTIGPASLRQAAMRGEIAAQLEVGARFAAGRGVAADLREALRWYSRAAAQGSAEAQYRLGAFYERGLGTVRDAERARAWYARAAEQGQFNAMHNLAVLSVSGGRSDYAAAAKWFAKAAEAGLADSQVNLAILHQNGLGVPKDLAQAYKWLMLAARGGDREASARALQIKPSLTADQLQTVEAAIAAWRANPHAAETRDALASTTTDAVR